MCQKPHEGRIKANFFQYEQHRSSRAQNLAAVGDDVYRFAARISQCIGHRWGGTLPVRHGENLIVDVSLLDPSNRPSSQTSVAVPDEPVLAGQFFKCRHGFSVWCILPKKCNMAAWQFKKWRITLKASIIFNPRAGAKSLQADILQAGKTLEQHGWHLTWANTEYPGHATILAQQSAARGDDIAIAVGGDGTVNEVVNGLVGTSTVLGIIPAGTANVFAADMRIPLPGPLPHQTLVRAAETLLVSQPQSVDVGSAVWGNGRRRYFLSWAGTGLDAAVSSAVESEKHTHRVWRFLGMFGWLITAFFVLREFRGTQMHISLDKERTILRRVIMVTVNNAQLYGRFWRLSPNAKLDDGWLDVVVMEGYGWRSSVRHIFNATTGKLIDDPDTFLFRVKHIHLETKEPMPVHLDAEAVGYTPLTVEIVPQSLRVMLPPNAPPNRFAHREGAF